MTPLPPVASLRLVFAMNGAGIALWFPRIPDVKAALDVDLFTLSLCFFFLPVGTLIGFFVAPPLIARIGARRACRQVGPLFVLLFILPAFATTPVLLAAALFLAGLTIATVEIAMNGKVAEFEKSNPRRIMASCHGAWSIGSMSGALIGGAAATLGISFGLQQLVMSTLFALVAYQAALGLPVDGPAVANAPRPKLRMPRGVLLFICLLPMGGLILEGAMMEWSALFLRNELGLTAMTAGVTYAVFALSMAAGRFRGDHLIERFGMHRVLVGSCLASTVGITTFALSSSPATAVPAALVLGLGLANIYPMAMSRAAEVPGPSAEENIATVGFVAFSTYLAAPPIIGALASVLGLGMTFLVLAPLAVYPMAILVRALGAQNQQA